MTKLTITEALADLKTTNARIAKQTQFLNGYIVRNEALKDPLEKDGGSAKVLRQTVQSIGDLGQNVVAIRRAIAKANSETTITLEGVTRTIHEWLVWRKEVAPHLQKLNHGLLERIKIARVEATKKGGSLVAAETETKPNDVIVALNEKELSDQLETLEKILGALDGQLSLKNATTFIEF